MKITYPSVDKLLDRVGSRYSLSVLASRRAHKLETGNPVALDKFKSSKSVSQALEEIATSKIVINPNHRTNTD